MRAQFVQSIKCSQPTSNNIMKLSRQYQFCIEEDLQGCKPEKEPCLTYLVAWNNKAA